MFNRNELDKKLKHSLIERELSVFKESAVQTKKIKQQKEKLPRPVLNKRPEKQLAEIIFYSVMILTALIGVGISTFFADLFNFSSSVIAFVFSVYSFYFTNPSKWRAERNNLAFWNASVTMSVLIKSIHIRIYHWRNVLTIVFANGYALSSLFNLGTTGVFGALFLLSSLFYLVERSFERYSKTALILSWVSLLSIVIALTTTNIFPLHIALFALLFYQLYERVKSLEIKEP